MQFSNIEDSSICPTFSPCSNYFCTLSNNNLYIKEAACLDLKNYSQILIKELKDQKTSETVIPKFSPNSKLIALQFKKKVQIYDLHGNLKIRIRDDSTTVDGMIWSKDSSQVIVFFGYQYSCTIYNFVTQAQAIIKNPKFTNQNGCIFSKGSHPGVFMAMLERNNCKDCIGIYFTETWQLINYITLDSFDAAKIQFTENGQILVIDNKINFKVYIVDIYRGVLQSYGNKDYVMGVCCHKFSNSSMFLALGAHDDCIHLLNALTWRLIAEIQMSPEIDLSTTTLMKEEHDDRFLPVQGSKFKIPKYQQQKKDSEPSGISILQFSPDDRYLAVKIDTMVNCVFIYEICSLTLFTVIFFNGKQVKDLKWMSQGQRSTLCVVYGTSNLLMWRESVEDSVFEIKVPTSKSTDIKISKIQTGRERRIIFWSAQSKKYVFANRHQEEECF